MNLQKILNKIDKFNVRADTEDYEITEFLDEISNSFLELGELEYSEKKRLIQSFFNYLKRQSPELDENWSFVHLIESIDKPDYRIYDDELIKFNEENPTVTSILLLNRFTNSLEVEKRQLGINLLKKISENTEVSETIREKTRGFLDYQIQNRN